MARPLRIQYDGAIYHVTSRGNARKAIYTNDADRELFLSILHRVTDKYHWRCHAYCLMNNHYHLVIETPDGNLSQGMRALNGIYTQTYNKHHNRVGHIFQGRFNAIVIDKETHLLEVCRYVVLNPVRSRSVARPADWRWSSYRGTVGQETPHPCLTPDWVLGQFGARRPTAQKQYEEFVVAGIMAKQAQPLWDRVKGQVILGDEDFTQRMTAFLSGEEVTEIPKGQRFLNRPSLSKLFGDIATKEKRKRNELIKKAVEKHGYSQNEVATHLRLHYTSVSRILTKAKVVDPPVLRLPQAKR